MKKVFLLFACIYAIVNSNAQQPKLDSLLSDLKQHPQDDTIRLNLLYKLSTAYRTVNPTEGINVSNEGIALAKKLSNEIALGNLTSNKGVNYLMKGEYDSALLELKQSLQIFEKHNYERGIFSALNAIGIIQFSTSDYLNALVTDERNLTVAENNKDTNQIIAAATNLGLVFRTLANFSEALQNDLIAINLAERSDDQKDLPNIYAETGLTYRGLKETDKAREYCQKALAICMQLGNKREEATILSALGQIAADSKDNKEALSYYNQAISVGDSIGNIQTVAATLTNIGDVYKSLLDNPTAIRHYQKAITIFQRLGDKNNTSYLLGAIGDAYASIPREHDRALSYMQQSLAMAKQIGSLERRLTTLLYLRNFYEKRGEYKKALEVNKQANTVQDSIFNDKTKSDITQLEMQYQFGKTKDSIRVVTDQQQALSKAEIQRQHIIRNALIAGSLLLVLAGIVGFIFYKRIRDVRFQKNQAELQSQVSDTEMKALRAQMNPHFIFNSLNSIADYIDKNQTTLASDFTVKFARLMRLVLDNSEHKEIPLADDLKALELYMKLENLRLQDKFEYSIQVDDNIDKENTLVPPLILQPFVENSIWHGVANKEGRGCITIYIHQEDNMLKCVVEDDGVGIKPPTLNPEKKSVGMKITKARVDVINKLKSAGAFMNVSNKLNGVRAEVTLPLELRF